MRAPAWIPTLWFAVAVVAQPPEAIGGPMPPLFRVVDLEIGETTSVRLANGDGVSVKLVALRETRCEMRGAVRRAEVEVETEEQTAVLGVATYHLPITVGRVQIDCPVSRGYTRGSSKDNVWALDKAARLRVWPAGSPWIRPGTFGYPVTQRWFASDTQMGNDPCYVNACDVPGEKDIYYHYGLDFGGAEGLVDVLAATGGIVVSRAEELLPGEYPPLVRPRYDVVYIRDDRGWYYRYSHLATIADSIAPGSRIGKGTLLGVLGKEGGSGGWTHLHFDIAMPQPSGRYGITDAYAFAFQAYREQHQPEVLAVARPHRVAWVGQGVELDAQKSWHREGIGSIERYEWFADEVKPAIGPVATRRYARAGHYTETVKVIGNGGALAYDFAVVQVFDPEEPVPVPPSIHVAFHPTQDIRPGDEITFKVRTFGVRADEGEEVWDFGDGSPARQTRSDGNAQQHNPNGYAITTHRFREPGDYIVSVRRRNNRGQQATGKVWVRIAPRVPESVDSADSEETW